MRTINGAGRWVLLLALAAGLVGMHHLEAGSMHAPSMSVMVASHATGHVPEVTASGSAMDMAMHLCLAILAAALLAGLLLVAMVVALRRPPPASPGGVVPAAARPPPRSAVRLALLCVLRD